MNTLAAFVLRNELVLLDLSGCDIDDNGAEVVAELLKHTKTVMEVDLWDCFIGTRGMIALAEALKHNRTVKTLTLENNYAIGNDGGEALIKTLNDFNVSITNAHMFQCEIGPENEVRIKFLTEHRNGISIPAAVRRASLYLIFSRRIIADAGDFAIFPKEIVKMIAMEVWATRKDPIWIGALRESERARATE